MNPDIKGDGRPMSYCRSPAESYDCGILRKTRARGARLPNSDISYTAYHYGLEMSSPLLKCDSPPPPLSSTVRFNIDKGIPG